MENHITYDAWQQLRLIPPSTIRIELVCFLDGPTETATVGFKVTDADTDDVVALGCDRPISHAEAYSALVSHAERLLELARQNLSPF